MSDKDWTLVSKTATDMIYDFGDGVSMDVVNARSHKKLPFSSVGEILGGEAEKRFGNCVFQNGKDGHVILDFHLNMMARNQGPRLIYWPEVTPTLHHGFLIVMRNVGDRIGASDIAVGLHFTEGRGSGFVKAEGSDAFYAITKNVECESAYVAQDVLVSKNKREVKWKVGDKAEPQIVFTDFRSDFDVEKNSIKNFLVECLKAVGTSPETCGFRFKTRDLQNPFADNGAYVRFWWTLRFSIECAIKSYDKA